MSAPIKGLRSLVLKITRTTTLPQVCASFFRPFRACFRIASLPRACALGCNLAPLRGYRMVRPELDRKM